MRRPRRWIGALAAVGASGWLGVTGAAPQAPPVAAATEVLVLDETAAVRMALENSAELVARQAAVHEREQRNGVLGIALKNPELRIQDIPLRFADRDDAQQLEVGVRWQPPKIGEVLLRRQDNIVDAWEERVDAADARGDMVADVRTTYAEVFLLKEIAALDERREALEEQHATCIEQGLAVGQDRLIDRVKALRRLAEARREASRARQRQADSREWLHRLIGSAREFILAPCPAPSESPDLEALCAQARRNRPELQLAEQTEKLNQTRRRAEFLKAVPWPSFLGVTRHFDEGDEDWDELLLGIDVPVFTWILGVPRAPADRLGDPGLPVTAAAEAIDLEVAERFASYNADLAEWRSSEAENDRLQPEIRRMVAEAREQGTLPTEEVLDLELAGIEMRLQALEARLELTTTAIELCRVVGADRWEDLAPQEPSGAP